MKEAEEPGWAGLGFAGPLPSLKANRQSTAVAWWRVAFWFAR